MSVRFGTSLELHGVGFTSNISSRGLGVVAQTVHPAGTRLRFELKLSNADFCRVEGVVAWSMKGISALQVPGSMGVRLDSADEAFFRFLATQTPESHEPAGAKTVPSAPSQGAPSKASAVTIPSGRPSAPSAPPPPRRPDSPTMVVSPPSTPPRTPETSFIASPPSAAAVSAPPPPAVTAPPPSRPSIAPPAAPAAPAAAPTVVAAASAAEAPAPAPLAAPPAASTTVAVAKPASEPTPAPISVPPPGGADWWQEPDTDRKELRFGGGPRTPRVPRFFDQIPIRFGVTSHLDLRGFTENISRTGMAITCPYPLTPGDTVLFALTLPDESKCHGTASVMWTRLGRHESRDQPVMGIRIKRVEKTFRDLLDQLARRH